MGCERLQLQLQIQDYFRLVAAFDKSQLDCRPNTTQCDVGFQSANLADNGDGTLTFSADIPTSQDGALTSVNVKAATDSGSTVESPVIPFEGYELEYRFIKRPFGSWAPQVSPSQSPDRWWTSRFMIFGNVERYRAAMSENQQLIDYYIPNTSNWGIRVDNPDILSYPQLGPLLWEKSGTSQYSVPSEAKTTAQIISWLTVTESDTYFFEAGLEKETTHRHTPSVMFDINYEQPETTLRLKIPLYGRKKGDKIPLLVTFTNMYYETDDDPMRLEFVKFKGELPINYDDSTKEITYLIEAEAGGTLTVDNTSFEWPKTSKTTSYDTFTQCVKRGRFRFDSVVKTYPIIDLDIAYDDFEYDYLGETEEEKTGVLLNPFDDTFYLKIRKAIAVGGKVYKVLNVPGFKNTFNNNQWEPLFKFTEGSEVLNPDRDLTQEGNYILFFDGNDRNITLKVTLANSENLDTYATENLGKSYKFKLDVYAGTKGKSEYVGSDETFVNFPLVEFKDYTGDYGWDFSTYRNENHNFLSLPVISVRNGGDSGITAALTADKDNVYSKIGFKKVEQLSISPSVLSGASTNISIHSNNTENKSVYYVSPCVKGTENLGVSTRKLPQNLMVANLQRKL